MTALPTIEECQAFLATINRGRVAIGLDPLDVLDFDGAVPDAMFNCLSARNLFALSEGFTTAVMPGHVENVDPRLCVVLDGGRRLPESIRAITEPFDACADKPGTTQQATAALRSRMVAAGVVAP